MIREPSSLTLLEIENVERLTLRWVYQALADFGSQPWEIFDQSPDEPGHIAEDITREALDSLPGYNIRQRILGTVDYRKARYIVLPDTTLRQALFVDSKAERSGSSATLQMSQLSLEVRQRRAGAVIAERGSLPTILTVGESGFLATTILLHFQYCELDDRHCLERIRICAIPNGILQEVYNPTPEDTIWVAGRNAPTLGEAFRVRLSFARLRKKARWRVQEARYNRDDGALAFAWEE